MHWGHSIISVIPTRNLEKSRAVLFPISLRLLAVVARTSRKFRTSLPPARIPYGPLRSPFAAPPPAQAGPVSLLRPNACIYNMLRQRSVGRKHFIRDQDDAATMQLPPRKIAGPSVIPHMRLYPCPSRSKCVLLCLFPGELSRRQLQRYTSQRKALVLLRIGPWCGAFRRGLSRRDVDPRIRPDTGRFLRLDG